MTAGSPRYDRRVRAEFEEALSAGGPMHELVALVHSDVGAANGLDLRLRSRPGQPGARATLYLGLTQVLRVHHLGPDRYKLERQRGKGFADKLDPTLFDPAWSEPQSLAHLVRAWPAVMTYVEAAVRAAPPKYLSSEGRVQALLGRGGSDFAAIDREVVISFPNQSAKDAALGREAAGIHAAREQLATTQRWAEKGEALR